jgi:hypothetical protein
MSKYEHIKNSNYIYSDFIKCNTTEMFNEFMILTLMAKENVNMDGALRYVKYIKDETEYGLKICKEWYDLLRDLGLIINIHNNFEIKDEIEQINTMDDIIFIVENELDINHFLRISKLKKIKYKINGNIESPS